MLQIYKGFSGAYTQRVEVIISDHDLGWIAGLRQVFPRVSHLLCQWHINKNVLAKCKKFFSQEADWISFLEGWQSMVKTADSPQFEKQWEKFSDKWAPLEKGKSARYPEADVESPPMTAEAVEYVNSV